MSPGRIRYFGCWRGVVEGFLRTDSNVPSNNLTPPLVKVPVDPRMNLASEPLNISNGIVTNRLLAFCISSSTDIDYMDKGIGVSQVIQELIAKTLPFGCTRNESCNVQYLYRNVSLSFDTPALTG